MNEYTRKWNWQTDLLKLVMFVALFGAMWLLTLIGELHPLVWIGLLVICVVSFVMAAITYNRVYDRLNGEAPNPDGDE